ncbi:mediator of RNA polymerase II transcription subunit 15 [Hippocampus comes]|uniref:mediator of RNA polymerase II transcription subunit 15 n=1 Tax=Hippocampus comes TaxID=109280 RepID=UPI00094E508C|nr:PREDICTED: mediator of RNA polymerase II transcription subunit 15 [Hippocampus comes]
MEVPGPDSDWRSPQFRQKVVAQIEEAKRKAGSGHSKSSTEMENQVYIKAKTREEYLSLVARLIIHYRDIHKKTMGGPDPINALTNLTGVGGGPGAIGMGPRPTGAPVGGLGAMAPMQIGQHAMPGVSGNPQPLGGPAQLALQQQQQQNLQFQQFQQQQFQVQQQMRAQQQQMHQNQQQQNQQQQNQMHQSRMQQQQQQMVQLQLQQQHAQSIQHMVQQQGQPGPMQPLLQQQQQAPMVPQSLAGQMATAQHVPINSLSQQQHQLKMQQAFQARAALQQQHQMAAASGQLVRPNMQIPARLPRPPLAPAIPPPNAAAVTQQVQQHAMMSSPSPVQVQTPQSMPPPPQPSPQPPTSQPNSASSGPTPSPGGFQPSPSPQPSQSPSTARTPQNYGVPSPGPLSTPGNPNSVMSPAGAASQEDQQYMEKLKQLSKYIEPLRRMINKIDKNEERKKDLSKMKSLLNILTDPNTRCPLKTLQKCEIALEKLKNDMAVPTPPPPLPPKQPYLCQPLLDAVMANLRSPVFNHSLHRTFAPAMAAIHGPPITGPLVLSRKRKQDEDERQTVPNILQGEVARLDVKFLVHLDPAHCSNNGAVHLLCKLEDKNLPSVPPLQLSVPADYPDQSPYWSDHADQYGANHFLQAVHRTLASKLLQLPDKHSLTEILHTWAQSVRQACLSAA